MNTAVKVNIRHLENKNVHLEGEITPGELELTDVDELIHVNEPLRYELEVEQNGQNLLVTGRLALTLDCECVRCLRPVEQNIVLDPYNALVPLEGEDAAPVVNDLVDLTPFIREDILLAFPQHPLCESECGGLKNRPASGAKDFAGADQTEETSSAWAELDKLKL